MYENTVLAGFFSGSVPALDKSKDQMYYDDIKMISKLNYHMRGELRKKFRWQAPAKEGIVWVIKVRFRKRKN